MSRMQRRRKYLVAALVVLSVAGSILYVTVGETVSRASISHSVAAGVGSGYFGSCRRRAGKTWACQLMTSDASNGGIAYAVTTSGRCWHGTRVASGGIDDLPPRISGCVGLMDQLRLDDHFENGTSTRRPGFF
jgi:hypothetical protein